MDDKALLEAIGQMMEEQEKRLDQKLSEMEQRITKSTVALMDAEFKERFNLLAENQDEILRRMPTEEDAELLDTRLAALEAVVRKHSREIAALKNANCTDLHSRRCRVFGAVCFICPWFQLFSIALPSLVRPALRRRCGRS